MSGVEDKRSEDVVKYSKELAMRGYVVVSVDYRLAARPWYRNVRKATFDAQEDLRAAIRFLRKNAAEYRIDTDRIIASGDSAGAITSMFVSYVKEAQYEGNSGNPGFSSHTNGVISISGEIKE